MSVPDEPPSSGPPASEPPAPGPDQYLVALFVEDEDQFPPAILSLKPTLIELLARHRAGLKNTLEDYVHTLWAISVQFKRHGNVMADFRSGKTVPVSFELIDLLVVEVLGPKRVATFEQRLAEIEDYCRKHPNAKPSQIAAHFEQPGVRGWSRRSLRRKIGAWLRKKVGHSD